MDRLLTENRIKHDVRVLYRDLCDYNPNTDRFHVLISDDFAMFWNEHWLGGRDEKRPINNFVELDKNWEDPDDMESANGNDNFIPIEDDFALTLKRRIKHLVSVDSIHGFVKRIDTIPSTVYTWIDEERHLPSTMAIVKICNAYRVSMNWMFGVEPIDNYDFSWIQSEKEENENESE